MLKEQLLKEAKELDASVELDSIFESVELSPEVRAQFATVFETVTKKQAVQLAETHIQAIAELADEKLAEALEESTKTIEANLVETAEKFFAHLGEQWLQENQVAVDRGIKADLFESLATGLKGLFIEHNVVVPEESIDVVAEMEQSLEEAGALATTLLDEKNSLQEELKTVKRNVALKEATEGLTLTQKEKVEGLVEGLDYSDTFTAKVGAIVEMVKTSKINESTENALNESTLNNNDPAGLNYQAQTIQETQAAQAPSRMSIYTQAAKAIA